MSFAAATVPFTGFEIPLEILILGLITGLSYALLAMGLTLAYKISRVLNFAHGDIGALVAAVIPWLVLVRGVSYWVALPLALAAAAGAGALMEVAVIRRLEKAPRLTVLVATIGAGQLFFALAFFIPRGDEFASGGYPTPFEHTAVIGNLTLNAGHFLILGVAPLLVVGLGGFFRYTKLGIAGRALADNVDAARLTGIPARRVATTIWILVGLLAGLSAILLGPTRPVGSLQSVGPSLLIRALGAAMLGGLVSLPRAFAGGIAIGVIELLVSWNYPTGGSLEVALFVVIVGGLLVQGRLGNLGRLAEASSWSLVGGIAAATGRSGAALRQSSRRWVGGAALAVAVLFPLVLSPSEQVLASTVVVWAMIGLSLTVLVGYAGQISLGQFALVGVGALVGGRTLQLGYPTWMGLFYAVLAGTLAAVIIGIPALRIRGLFLAVCTLAFAVAANTWLFDQDWLVQETDLGGTSLAIARPTWFGIDFRSEHSYYYLVLTVFVVIAAIVHRLPRTGLGRAFLAVRDNEPSASSLGISPWKAKLSAFAISGAIASTGGFFYGSLLVSFPDRTVFGPDQSLALVGMVIVGGVNVVSGAVLGAVFIKGIPYFVPSDAGVIADAIVAILSGLGVLIAVLVFPGGLSASIASAGRRLLGRGQPEDETPAVAGGVSLRPRTEPVDIDSSAAVLECRAVVVRFGGTTAVDHVSLDLGPGEVVGLVGPNGAGKTTLFEVLSGHTAAEEGEVILDGTDITRLKPFVRARLGLGRTFQQARLFDEMSLIDAVKVPLELDEPSEIAPSLLGLPPSRAAERRKHERAMEVLNAVGMDAYAQRPVAALSTGMRRLAELAAIVAQGAHVLLLDEPTAGIAQREVEAFMPALRSIQAHLGASILIIEHDIPLLTELVDRMYVLSAGQLIAAGDPEVVRSDPAVIAAYLGTDERMISRSGAVGERD